MNFFHPKSRPKDPYSSSPDEGIIIVEANEDSSVPGEIHFTTSFQDEDLVQEDPLPAVIVPGMNGKYYGFKKHIVSRSIYVDGIEINADELNALSDDDLDDLISNMASNTNEDEDASVPSRTTSFLPGEEKANVADLHNEPPVDFTEEAEDQALPATYDQPTQSLQGVVPKSDFPFETLSSIGRSQIVGMVDDENLQQGDLQTHSLQLCAGLVFAIVNSMCRQILRGLTMITYIFFGGWSMLTNFVAAISKIYQILRGILSTVTRVGRGVYKNTKVMFRRRLSGASHIVIGFMAGVFTTIFFVLTLWLMRRGTASAFNFVYINMTAIVDPCLMKGTMIRNLITQNTLPVVFQAPMAEISEPLSTTVVSINHAPIVLSTFPSDIQDAAMMHQLDIIQHHKMPHSMITNQVIEREAIERANDHTTMNRVLGHSNRSLTIDGPSDVFDAARFSMNALAVLFTLTVAIVSSWVIPKSNVDKSMFEAMSGKELQAECKKRNLTPATLKEDMIRHLSLHDGLAHSFPVIDLAKYHDYTRADLQRYLKNLGGKTSGKKDDLQYRLALTREALYMESSMEELCDILEQSGLNFKGEKSELARRLAEAGPSLPI